MYEKKVIIIVVVLLVALISVYLLGGIKTKSNTLAVIKSVDYDISNYKLATFAGGCFWCMESPFEKLEGVVDVVSGYTGGNTVNPTYQEVTAGGTGHLEAVQVVYDPKKISYEELLNVFWRQINPTDAGGQFVDRGSSYASGIFYHDEEQRALAEKSKEKLVESNKFKVPIVTPIVKATDFYLAEEYHQDYYIKNPTKYNFYRFGSGRDKVLDSIWGSDGDTLNIESNSQYAKPTEEELRERLTPLEYKVTQENGTERPFDNKYWDNKEEGIYVDIASGEPLFSSKDKYDSGTGWPSFTQPLVPENIVEREDRGIFGIRTEVRSRYGDSHLGHVFTDGPQPTGLRYCMNSASLRFIKKEELLAEGYEEFAELFN